MLSLSTNVEPRNIFEASQSPTWCQAMDDEYRALVNNNPWTITSLPTNKKHVDCKWVYKIKLKQDGSEERKKARLVTREFTQQAGLDYQETFSPVAKLSAIKALLAVAACKNWHLHQLHINNAFLHGGPR